MFKVMSKEGAEINTIKKEPHPLQQDPANLRTKDKMCTQLQRHALEKEDPTTTPRTQSHLEVCSLVFVPMCSARKTCRCHCSHDPHRLVDSRQNTLTMTLLVLILCEYKINTRVGGP